jgi:hypothetical protein
MSSPLPLAAAFLTMCSCPNSSEVPDASQLPPDADSSDALDGVDTAAADAAVPVGLPGWLQVVGVPEDCPIEIATRPEFANPELRWDSDCGPGCEHLSAIANPVAASTVDGSPVLAMVALLPGSEDDGHTYWVFVDIDTRRVWAAFRTTEPTGNTDAPVCGIFDVGMGPSSLALTVSFYDFDASGEIVEREWSRVLRAELSDPVRTLRVLHEDDFGTMTASSMRADATHVAVLYNWGILRLFSDDGTLFEPTRGLAEFSGRATSLQLLADGVLLWEQWQNPTVIARSARGAPADAVRSVDGGETLGSDIRSLAADENTLAWLEARRWDDSAGVRERATVDQ